MSSDEEAKDILAAKIKHRGQCPFEKGHSGYDIEVGLAIGFVIATIFWVFVIKIHGGV